MIPEPGREAVHALLDTVASFDDSLGEDPGHAEELNRVLERVNEAGAVSATVNDDGQVVLDASQLLGGTVAAMNWLVEAVARAGDLDKEAVIAEVREFLDQEE
jgi:hypothetical protein